MRTWTEGDASGAALSKRTELYVKFTRKERNHVHRMAQVWPWGFFRFACWYFGFEVESGDDEDPLGVAMRESLHQWEREQDAALNAALAASLQEGGVAQKAASGKRPADDSCR